MSIKSLLINKNIVLIEDHNEALRAWRGKRIKNLDLVHIDAHMDFGIHPARPIEQVASEARSLEELKRGLEYSIAFRRYESDFDKQTNIGNYIYPAMQEGIVRDFYWVIPGGLGEFKKSLKIIKGILKNLSGEDPYQSRCTLKDGIISTKLLRRKLVICSLEKLPILKQKALLDIDTDFLIVDSLLNANNTVRIGERKCCISPDRLVCELRKKIIHPAFTTIAYSVNGGFTPMRYKILGDELAYRLAPKHFRECYGQKFIASVFFERFESTGKKEHYQEAVKLNPAYRVADNNYGLLYLGIRKFSKAKKEFLKVAKVDPKNPYPFIGLGNIALEKGRFYKARGYFSYALKLNRGLKEALFGLARVEFKLKNVNKAKRLLLQYQKNEPLQPQSHYILGRIYEKKKDFKNAATCYQDAMMLGLNNINVLSRLFKNLCYIKVKNDIINFTIMKYREFKKEFAGIKIISLKKKMGFEGFLKLEKKMAVLEGKLQKEGVNQWKRAELCAKTRIW